MRKITEIIIHTSATRPDWMTGRTATEKMNEIRRWHVEERGFSDVGYHWGIDRDGTRVTGRDRDKDGDIFEEIGAHTRGRNRNTLSIVLFGGYGSTATDAFEDNYTPEQNRELRVLINEIEGKLGDLLITGHNDYAAKACPGFKVDRWLYNEPPQRMSLMQSGTMRSNALIKAAGVVPPVVAAIQGVPWQTIAILGGVALIIFAASGFIDKERVRKWRAGDR